MRSKQDRLYQTLIAVPMLSKSSVKNEFSHHSSHSFLEWNSSVSLKLEVIWSSPLCLSMAFSRFVKEPRVFRSGSPTLQTPQLFFTSCLVERVRSLEDSSVGSSVLWGSFLTLLKVTSTCLPCKVCPLKVKPPSIAGKLVG